MNLLPWIDRQDNVSFWPLALPGADGRTNEWQASAARAAQKARHGWVRMVANMAMGAYDLYTTTADLPGPKWPDKSIEEVVKIAFRDKFIGSMDHPVIRRLQGLS